MHKIHQQPALKQTKKTTNMQEHFTSPAFMCIFAII